MKTRKTYRKPQIRSEKILEKAALACGKCLAGGPISQGPCRNKPRLS